MTKEFYLKEVSKPESLKPSELDRTIRERRFSEFVEVGKRRLATTSLEVVSNVPFVRSLGLLYEESFQHTPINCGNVSPDANPIKGYAPRICRLAGTEFKDRN